MKHSEAKLGRIFVIRLEDGDSLPDSIEAFASENGVERGMCILVGGAGPGSLVVGPEDGDAVPVVPMLHTIKDVHEIAGVGTVFPDETGKPVLHMHAALGREGNTRAGCVRKGVDIWKVGEVILLEITENRSQRKMDPNTGFELLQPEASDK
jgi:predicted DNA-binding protein with PD1-like motif